MRGTMGGHQFILTKHVNLMATKKDTETLGPFLKHSTG